MTDESFVDLYAGTGASHEDLRQKHNQLVDRLQSLEKQVTKYDTKANVSDLNGMDSRDASVIGQLEHGGRYSPRSIVSLYLTETDVRNARTAKQRTKALLKRDCFQPDGAVHIYRGGGGE